MEAENLKRSVVFIVFALVFSIILVAPLAHSGELVYDPGGTTIEVVQGDNFLIRHTLEWDEPENGAYAITMAWDCYDNEPSENFTFVGASAYFTTGPNAGESILSVDKLGTVPSPEHPGSTRYTLKVECPAVQKDSRNGQFNVDITLSASGAGGVPHIPGDHVIPFQFGGIIIIEKYIKFRDLDPITIRVLSRGVSVSISPSEKNGLPAQTLSYTVTVTNKGDFADNYNLTVSDNAGWGATLAQSLLTILAGENRTTTVSVTAPSDADENESTEIAVTASSQADLSVSDSDTCTARAAAVVGEEEGLPMTLIAIVVVVVVVVVVVALMLLRGRRAAPS